MSAGTIGGSVAAIWSIKRFEKIKAFGQAFISKGFNNPSHRVSLVEIEAYIKENDLGKFFGILDPWKKLPFLIGDDKNGYWFSQEKLDKYIYDYKYSKKPLLALLIILAVAIIGALLISKFI